MKIVILDGATIDPGLSWAPLQALGQLEVYPRTPADLVVQRIGDAEAVFISKVSMNQEVLDNCPHLKFIGVMATGYNNIDLEACRRLNIALCNIPAYSTDAVAQHTFALILEICSQVALHDQSVKAGDWARSEDFAYWKAPIRLLKGKSLGIVGYGNIGKKVAEIASAFGMTINVYSQNQEAAVTSDILSLHCPATDSNAGFVNKEFISRMKDGAILINTARGVLLNEGDVAEALQSGKLAAAGMDVLSKEPADPANPLIPLPNCFITPHMCWSPEEMRQIIIDGCAANLQSFLKGETLNRVDCQ
ncbi:D-2-hydroxyacid dehydrogenase [Aminipila butyrica]|uniref:D-2-hydroxyacid dehydrogenase n=1 Tax=Aminipila butyrica TaxID=433296 RepID=A0A858BS04_9FIRM|nr:D-2-hydroxyacid dehydrogenase [Aminipila butyrica]QIB68357.1 D-2-hydroxyacid dehydrogenase [Aminipila butyrica]